MSGVKRTRKELEASDGEDDRKSEAPVKDRKSLKGRSNARSGRGKKHCRGCGGPRPVEEFALNQDLCMNDKRALDNLTKAAAACGKKDELKAIVADDEKLAELMNRYHKECTGPDGKKRRGSPSAKGLFMDYMEEFESRQEVLMDDVGKMMDEETYIEFAATTKGGKLSSKEARLKWDEMKLHKDQYVTDHKGPNSSLRIRVSLEDLVTFRSATSVSKKLQLKRKTVKDPSEANLKGHFKDMMTGFDNTKESAGMDLSSIAKNMASGGQGLEAGGGVASCFDGAKVANMDKMLHFSEDEEDDDDGSASAAESTPGKTPKKPRKCLEADAEDQTEDVNKGKKSEPGSAKKGSETWFDVENEVIKAKRMWRNSIASLKSSLESKTEEANKGMTDAEEFKNNESVKEVYLSCKRRVVWAKAMVNVDGGKVDALIQAFCV
jgi:hypothetical protein